MSATRLVRGFSLLELVIVIVIVGMLAAVAIPRFASAAVRQRADAAARRVVADLTLARRHAEQSSAEQTVIFEVGAGRYRLLGYIDPDRPGSEYEVRLDREPYQAAIVAADFDGNAHVTFDGYGLPNAGGSVVLRVGDEVRTVTLDSQTGEATW